MYDEEFDLSWLWFDDLAETLPRTYICARCNKVYKLANSLKKHNQKYKETVNCVIPRKSKIKMSKKDLKSQMEGKCLTDYSTDYSTI